MICALSILLLFSSSMHGSSAEDCPKGTHFRCNSGECGAINLRCNGYINCPDGSDEENCEDYVCADTHYKCASHECVDKAARCNCEYNCIDGSDEVDCEEHECPKGWDVCSSGQCLNPSYRCDGQTDCSDGSDEEDCEDHDCPDTSHPCTTGHCLPPYRKCDGIESCLDKSDEQNCPESSDVKYLEPGFGWDKSTIEALGWIPMGDNCCVACQASNAHPETTHFMIYKFSKYGVYCKCSKAAEDKEATSVSIYKIFGQSQFRYHNKTIAKLIDLPFRQDGLCVED